MSQDVQTSEEILYEEYLKERKKSFSFKGSNDADEFVRDPPSFADTSNFVSRVNSLNK